MDNIKVTFLVENENIGIVNNMSGDTEMSECSHRVV